MRRVDEETDGYQNGRPPGADSALRPPSKLKASSGSLVPWGLTARRALSRLECLDRLRQNSIARVAMTSGALPAIAMVRYYMSGETIFFDMGSDEVTSAAAGQVVAFESGTADGEQLDHSWSACTVGLAMPTPERKWGRPMIKMLPELVRGWIDC